jgi:hypothetical protein
MQVFVEALANAKTRRTEAFINRSFMDDCS